jgi:hypothetical protein
MITTLILSLCIPLAFVAGGFVAFKGVQLGLKWQIQTTKQETPTLEIKNPISNIIQNTHTHKQEKDTLNILDEWVNGAEER